MLVGLHNRANEYRGIQGPSPASGCTEGVVIADSI